MINFSKISRQSLVGKGLRHLLRLIPEGAILPILQGPLKGKKWIKDAGTNGFWLGTYELAEQEEFKRYLEIGSTVFDVGAHTGFYSLLAAELVGPSGRVVAFEPFPRNIEILKRHIAMNKFKNIQVIPAAVGRVDGRAAFVEGEDTFTGRIGPKGSLEVAVSRLDTLVQSGVCPPPRLIKIDIEGKFPELLEGAMDTVRKHKPVLLFEADFYKDAASFNILKELGYKIEPIGDADLAVCPNFIAYPEV